MNDIDVSRRKLGVTFEGKSAEVLVWAPEARQMAVKINGENSIALAPKDYGYWYAATDKIKPGDTYKFIIDNEKELPDPVSLSQPNGVHETSAAIDIKGFEWSDKGWNNIPQEDYIVYELHTGTYTTAGTFAAIEEKLDYLVDLGITAIELMPVAQFPGGRNWGYDGVYPFAVQNTYGDAKGLQHLVNACHAKGLAVVLDVVYNHIGPEGNYLGAYGPYFTDKYKTPWGSAINFDDAWCDGVRRFFIENVLMWFRDFHIDAVRMDAVHAIRDFSPTHILREMKEYVNELMQQTGRTHYMIVETDLNDTRFINPLNKEGYGMNGQWMDEFHHALRVTASGDKSGYYADFEGIGHLAKSYRDAYVYDGQYSPHRYKSFGIKAKDNPGKQFVVFSQNHDQVGNRMLGERTSQLVSFEMQKLIATAVMVSPFLPLLFMGEEYGETNPFLYFVSHTDPELVEAVRKGRKAEFASFHAQGEAPDPQAEDTFRQSKLQWGLKDTGAHKVMLSYYKMLISLRKTDAVMRSTDRKQLDVACDEATNVLLLHRWNDNQHIFCLMNFSKEVCTAALPHISAIWHKLLDSAAPEWNGPAAAADAVAHNEQVTIQPESIIIYINEHV